MKEYHNKVLYNLLTNLLNKLNLSGKSDIIEYLSKEYPNASYNDEKIASIYLVTILLSNHPFFKDKMSELDWDEKGSKDAFKRNEWYIGESDDLENMMVHGRNESRIIDIVDDPSNYDYGIYDIDDDSSDYDYGICDIDDDPSDYDYDYGIYDEEYERYYPSDIPHFKNGGREYEVDNLEVINEILFNETSSKDKEFSKRLEEYDKKNYKEQQDVFNSISERLKNGDSIDIKMLFQFFRNAFAHNEWRFLENGQINLYHKNEETGSLDLDVTINVACLLGITREYLFNLHNVYYKNKTPNYFDEIMNYEADNLYLDTNQIIDLSDTLIKTLNNEEITKKIKDKIKEYHIDDQEFYQKRRKDIYKCIRNFANITEVEKRDIDNYINGKETLYEYDNDNGDIDEIYENYPDDADHIINMIHVYYPEINLEETPYSNEIKFLSFIKEIIINNYEIINPYKAKVEDYMNLVYNLEEYIGKDNWDNFFSGPMDYMPKLTYELNDYNRYDYKQEKDIRSTIEVLLNILFVQMEYPKDIIDLIDLSSIKLSEEYKKVQIDKFNKTKTNLLKELNKSEELYYEKYYSAKAKQEQGLKSATKELTKAEIKKDKFEVLVQSTYKQINDSYNTLERVLTKKNTGKILEHIRDSFAHGHTIINVPKKDSNIDEISFLIRDYDEDNNLTFEGTIQLGELLSIILTPTIVNRLFDKKQELKLK